MSQQSVDFLRGGFESEMHGGRVNMWHRWDGWLLDQSSLLTQEASHANGHRTACEREAIAGQLDFGL